MLNIIAVISLLQVVSLCGAVQRPWRDTATLEIQREQLSKFNPVITSWDDQMIRHAVGPFAAVVFPRMTQSLPVALSQSRLKVADCLSPLQVVIDSVPQDQRNRYNYRGQTFAHAITPIHWINGLPQMMHAAGVDLTARTIYPDRFEGSTLAHNVAGLCAKTSCSSKKMEKALRCLLFLYGVDDGRHFNCQSFGGATVWQLMDRVGWDPSLPQEDQYTLLDRFLERINSQARSS